MTEGVERVRRALSERGVTATTRTFDTAIPTAAAADVQLDCEPGAIANSLLFRVGDGVVLVVSSGACRVDTGRVARLMGVGRKKVRRADADLVLGVTGQRVGGVAPVGHPAPLRTLVDVATTPDGDGA